MKNDCRGVIPVVVLYVLGALALTQSVPNWRVTNIFAKGPQTAELRAAQASAAKAQAEAVAAQARYEAALREQKAKTLQQVQYSQQMVSGVPVALARAPQTPEVVFASGLAKRAATGLAAAIGDLPADKQAEIAFLVDQALSAKQVEVDAAKAALAIKDKELTITTAAKQVIEAKLPMLEQQAKAADAKAVAAEGVVLVKTNEVATYAEKAATKEKEAGSLGTLVDKLWHVLLFLGIAYALVHFALPSIAQEFPAVRLLQTANKAAKSIFSSHA